MQVSPIRVVVLEQPSTKVSKTITVDVGFRPAVAMVMNYKGGGDVAIAVDGVSSQPTGNAVVLDDKNALGSNGITFWDQGIKLGTTASFNENSAKIVCILFRDFATAAGSPTRSATTGALTAVAPTPPTFGLGTVPTTKSQFGAGDQFGGGSDTSEGQTSQETGESNARAAQSRGANVIVTLDP